MEQFGYAMQKCVQVMQMEWNSGDLDQTAVGFSLFAQTYLSQYLEFSSYEAFDHLSGQA